MVFARGATYANVALQVRSSELYWPYCRPGLRVTHEREVLFSHSKSMELAVLSQRH